MSDDTSSALLAAVQEISKTFKEMHITMQELVSAQPKKQRKPDIPQLPKDIQKVEIWGSVLSADGTKKVATAPKRIIKDLIATGESAYVEAYLRVWQHCHENPSLLENQTKALVKMCEDEFDPAMTSKAFWEYFGKDFKACQAFNSLLMTQNGVPVGRKKADGTILLINSALWQEMQKYIPENGNIQPTVNMPLDSNA